MSAFFRLLRRAGGPDRGIPVEALRASRRQVLKATAAASAVLFLEGPTAFARAARVRPRALVVGAGFAGLACAHELTTAGFDVRLLEARGRIGGRVLSFQDFVPDRTVEGGAELIGSNHPHWVAYAQRFGLDFLDVDEGEEGVPFVLGGRTISGDEAERLWAATELAQAALNDLARPIDANEPWRSPDAHRLDATSVGAWIRRTQHDPLVRAALEAGIGGDNGVPTSRLSLLALLAQVKGGGLEAYWTDSEVYRCRGGNQQLADRLADAIGRDRILLNTPVVSIRTRGSSACVTAADGRRFAAERVVLAVPPSVASRIRLDGSASRVPTPQMSSNVKYLSRVRSKFWIEHARSAYTLSDGDVAWTWDATDAQGDEGPACLTAFCGGDGAERVRARSREERDRAMGDLLDSWFPTYREHLDGTRFMDWPSDVWTRAGYSAWAPGEITRFAPLLRRGVGRLRFAGEHLSFAFMGYMEGALHSGVAVARGLAGARSS